MIKILLTEPEMAELETHLSLFLNQHVPGLTANTERVQLLAILTGRCLDRAVHEHESMEQRMKLEIYIAKLLSDAADSAPCDCPRCIAERQESEAGTLQDVEELFKRTQGE